MDRVVKPQTPFRPQVFLFRMLGVIFAVEALLLIFSFVKCSQPHPRLETAVLAERCPRLGQRAENIFEIAIATTLSLLAGGQQIKRSKTSGGDLDASGQEPLQVQQRELPPQRRQPPA